MQCVIYNRVSSMSQNSYTNSMSLHTQESICSKFANENGLNVRSVYKEVHSAFHKVPNVLKTVINLSKCNILISDISRFSRSVDVGLDMAKTALKNKNRIVFIQEQFSCSTPDDLILLAQHLQGTESESRTIGIRIKKARNYLIENGMHAGGTAPYGYDVVEHKAVRNQYEQNVLQFIRKCQQNRISSDDLNNMMIDITKTKIYDPIICYDKNDVAVVNITERLTNPEIADLLNSYDIDKRGLSWTAAMIKTALRSDYNQRRTCKRSLSNIKKPNQLTNLDSMGMGTDIGQISTQTNNINQRKPKKFKYNKTRQNNMQSDVVPVSLHKRRSTRLNPNMSFEFDTLDTNASSHDVFDNNDDNNNDDNIIEDVQLFNQFRQFRKMIKK
jgi:DNA invertase Pin-like site-specific DNA recombinase